ncbi:MAG: metal-sulfur cluster assembly factor [Chitinophagaceae bacterium]
MEVITNNNIKCTIALAGLYNVYDPEIGLNVVDLGLIYQIDFIEDEKRIEASITLTTQFCPMGESITNGVTQSLANAFKEYQVNVNLTFDPPWSSDRISPGGQEFLNH